VRRHRKNTSRTFSLANGLSENVAVDFNQRQYMSMNYAETEELKHLAFEKYAKAKNDLEKFEAVEMVITAHFYRSAHDSKNHPPYNIYRQHWLHAQIDGWSFITPDNIKKMIEKYGTPKYPRITKNCSYFNTLDK
jgi:hypothetical protein